MRVITTDIEGVFILEPEAYSDARGYFFEAFSESRFRELTGIATRFVQDNESRSRAGVVRGLHFQRAPHVQSKLVRVIEGEILDIAVDIRRGSPTFGRSVAVRLSGDNRRQLFVPRGFAHGFVALSEAIVAYKCDDYYAPDCEGSIRWDDTTLAINWGIEPSEAILSAKDLASPTLDECGDLFDYNVDYYA